MTRWVHEKKAKEAKSHIFGNKQGSKHGLICNKSQNMAKWSMQMTAHIRKISSKTCHIQIHDSTLRAPYLVLGYGLIFLENEIFPVYQGRQNLSWIALNEINV